MKKVSFFLLGAAFLASSLAFVAPKNPKAPITLAVQSDKSRVDFIGSKAADFHTGTFTVKGGSVQVEAGKLVGGSFVIDLANLKVTDAAGDRLAGHLKSADFFDVAKFGEATYTISSVNYTSATACTINGTLNIKGVGTIQVTNVYDMVPKENELNVFSISMDLNVPQVIANSHYKLWQDPIPAVEGDLPVIATDVKGSAKGTLTIVCDGSGKSGYYLQLDSLTIEIPTNIYDSNALTQLVYALGMEIEYVTGGIVDMNQMLLDMANGMLADEVMKVINDILDDMKIADANC